MKERDGEEDEDEEEEEEEEGDGSRARLAAPRVAPRRRRSAMWDCPRL
jgi:hypothetical protein